MLIRSNCRYGEEFNLAPVVYEPSEWEIDDEDDDASSIKMDQVRLWVERRSDDDVSAFKVCVLLSVFHFECFFGLRQDLMIMLTHAGHVRRNVGTRSANMAQAQ